MNPSPYSYSVSHRMMAVEMYFISKDHAQRYTELLLKLAPDAKVSNEGEIYDGGWMVIYRAPFLKSIERAIWTLRSGELTRGRK